MPPRKPRRPPVVHFEIHALRGNGWTLDSWQDDRAAALARAEAARGRTGCRGVKVIRETYYPGRHAAHERVILDTTRRRPKPARIPGPAPAATAPPEARAGPIRVAASVAGAASLAVLAAALAMIALA